jgi:DivIVA domain-containing protein
VRRGTQADALRDVDFPVTMRGYDRSAVDAWVQDAARVVSELESTQSRDSVVKAALDEVGEHTGDILKKAQEAADEITASSRSQAEGRLQRAETEAEALVSEAEARARDLENDTRALWDQRNRLIEDIRQLSDQLLALADDAGERLDPPDAIRPPEPEPQPESDPAEPEGDDADTAETPDLGGVEQPTVESSAARPDGDGTPPDERPTEQRPGPGGPSAG